MAFVADPTYFLVYDMLQMGKLNLTCGMHKMDLQRFILNCSYIFQPVSTDEHGIIPAALEEAIVQQSTKHGIRPLTENKPYRGLIYLIPTFDNPTGRCLSDG